METKTKFCRIEMQDKYLPRHLTPVSNMRNAPNRRHMRRTYLLKRAKANFFTLMATFYYTILPIGTFVLGWMMVESLYYSHDIPIEVLVGLLILAGLVAVWALNRGVRFSKKARREADRYFAPPVNVNHLPGDEVLLRASHLPTVLPSDLVRPALPTKAPPVECLLRPSYSTPKKVRQGISATAAHDGSREEITCSNP